MWPLLDKSKIDNIKVGNINDDFNVVKEADWIVEAVVERIDIKHQIYKKIFDNRKDGAIVSSNTSSIPIKILSENMTDEQKKLFGIEKLNVARSSLPAITHVDYSARIQTVHKDTNQKYYNLINEFKKLTGCPIVVNTSFNVRGEPIVNSPTDAFNCFMGTQLDFLVIGNFILDKKKQNQNLIKNYKDKFELD